jgi:hypothetical protein
MFEEVQHETVQTQTPTARYSNSASSNIAGTVDQAAQESPIFRSLEDAAAIMRLNSSWTVTGSVATSLSILQSFALTSQASETY